MIRTRGKATAIESDEIPSGSSKIGRQIPMGAEKSRVKQLENLVLGGEREFFDKLDEKRDEKESDDKPDQPSDEPTTTIKAAKPERKAAWEDEDDKLPIEIVRKRKMGDILDTVEELDDGKLPSNTYRDRLKKRFDRTTKSTRATGAFSTPSWANLKGDKRKKKRSTSDTESESEDDETDHVTDLSKRTGSYVGTDAHLPKGLLQFKKLRDPTSGYRVKATITSIEFNKQTPVLMVAGYTQRVQLFKIDGEDNPMLQSMKFDEFPIETAQFSGNGEKIYAGSPLHDYFYYYDLIADKAIKVPQIRSLNQAIMGKFAASPDGNLLAFQGPHGNIFLLSAKTYELICTLKMNGSVSALAFSSNGSALYSHGTEGEVYVWDVRNRICAHRFYDDGCIRGLCIAASTNDRYLATGSNTGVVNIYDVDALRGGSQTPKPLKAIMNLTTSAKSLRFNSTSEMLALASDVKKKQLRLFHTPSLTTLENFPSFRDNLTLAQTMDFSPNSAYMAVGCENGRAGLYRLLHYSDY